MRASAFLQWCFQKTNNVIILFFIEFSSFFHVCGGGSESSNLHRRYSPLAPPLYNRNDALGEGDAGVFKDFPFATLTLLNPFLLPN